MSNAVIVSGVRTAVGAFGGSLKDVSAKDLGAIVIRETLIQAGFKPALPAHAKDDAPDTAKNEGLSPIEQQYSKWADNLKEIAIDEVIMGNVIGAGQGQNAGRQAMIRAGLPKETTAITINKVCASGMKAIALAGMASNREITVKLAGFLKKRGLDKTGFDIKKASVQALGDIADPSVLPVLSVASLVGFGAVVAAMPAFAVVRDWVLNIGGGPLVSLALATNILAALTGSASGGLTIALEALGGPFMQMAADLAIDPALMHRVAVIGAGTLDSLPHNGAVVTLLAVCGTTHKQSYLDIVMVAIVSAILGLIAIRGLARKTPDQPNLYLNVTSSAPGKLTAVQILETLGASGARASLKRFDETPDALEASFLVDFKDAGMLQQFSTRLRELSPEVRISCLHDGGIGESN